MEVDVYCLSGMSRKAKFHESDNDFEYRCSAQLVYFKSRGYAVELGQRDVGFPNETFKAVES